MRRLPFILVALLLALPAHAEYVGVAGDYDSGTAAKLYNYNQQQVRNTISDQTRPGDFVGVADGFYGDGMSNTAPGPVASRTGVGEGMGNLSGVSSAPAMIRDARTGEMKSAVPSVTITPKAQGTVRSGLSEGNFVYVPEGAAAPPPPPTPTMDDTQRAVANNYPPNAYSGPITDANPVLKEYNQTTDVSGAPALYHGQKFKGRNAVAGNGPRTVTVNNNADWEDLWQNAIGTAPPGHLGRGQKAVLVFDGRHAYSGYAADAEIAEESGGRIIVNAAHITPSQRSAISPENSAPYAAIVLDASGKTVDVREGKTPAGRS